jgi:hypothetical protein
MGLAEGRTERQAAVLIVLQRALDHTAKLAIRLPLQSKLSPDPLSAVNQMSQPKAASRRNQTRLDRLPFLDCPELDQSALGLDVFENVGC